MEQLPVADAFLVVGAAPELQARQPVTGEFGDERHGLAGLDGQAEGVGAVEGEALRHEAERGRHAVDPAGIEIRPDDAGAGMLVPLGDEPTLDGFVGRIAQREHEPAGARPARRRRDRHAPRGTVRADRRFDLQRVASAVVDVAGRGNVAPVRVGADFDRLQRAGRGAGRAEGDHGQEREQRGDRGQHEETASHSASPRWSFSVNAKRT